MEKLNFNLDVEELDSLTCEECNGGYFTPSFIIKKVSALQSPTGQKMMIPIQVFKCTGCGEVINTLDN
jgi:hypothetical protein